MSGIPWPVLDVSEGSLSGRLPGNAWATLIDLAAEPGAARPAARERAAARLKENEAAIKTNQDDHEARFGRALANYDLGNAQAALDDLEVLGKKSPDMSRRSVYRAIALARLHHKKEALEAAAAANRNAGVSEDLRHYMSVVVAAELGENLEQACAEVESALKANPRDSDLYYDVACAYSLAAHAVMAASPARGQEMGVRAIQLLKDAIRNGFSDYDHMEEDVDLESIRSLPAFGEIMKAGHLHRRYAAVWSGDTRFEAVPVYGLDPAAHEAECRKLIGQGFRPVSISVTRAVPEGPLVTSSVWHRPVVSEEVKDGLAMRQARAAAALDPARESRFNLAAVASQSRPSAAQLHNQLAETTWRRTRADRRRAESDRARHRSHARWNVSKDGRHPVSSRDLDTASSDPGAGNMRRRNYPSPSANRSSPRCSTCMRTIPTRASTARPDGRCENGASKRSSRRRMHGWPGSATGKGGAGT